MEETSRSQGFLKHDTGNILCFRKNLLPVFEIKSLESAMFDGKPLGLVGLREPHILPYSGKITAYI